MSQAEIDSNPRTAALPAVLYGRIAASLYVGALFVFGAIPNLPGPAGSHDKLLHLLAFAALTPLLFWAGPDRPLGGAVPVQRLVSSAAVATLIGALLELWQLLWPTRSAEWLDLAVDAAGACLAAVFLALAWSLWRRYA